MARFYGRVGYAIQQQTKPGVFEDVIVERKYYGEIIRNTRGLSEGENLHKDLNVSSDIRILADAYALGHFHAIRYVEWAGVLWTVRTVEVQSPRLLLRIGEVYNGPEGAAPVDP